MNSEQKIAELEKENRQLKSELEELRKEKQQVTDERKNSLFNQLIDFSENAPFMAAVIDCKNYKYITANRVHEQLVGADVTGSKFKDVIHEDFAYYLDILRKVCKTGVSYVNHSAKVRFKTMDSGDQRIMDIIFHPVKSEQGKTENIFILGTEVAEQIRQKNLLEQFLNEIPVGVALHEGPEFITTVVNEGYNKFALAKGNVMHRKVAEIWPEIADQIIPLLNNVYKTGEPYHATDAEFTVERGKGPEKAWFSFSYLPFKGEKDKITGVLVWAFETTPYVLNRKKAENANAELQKRTAQLEATIDSLPDGYIIYDNAGKIIRMNSVAEKIIGFSDEEKKLPYKERIELLKVLIPDGQPFPLEQIPSKLAQKGERVRGVTMKINRRNHQYWLSVSASPVLLPDGKKQGVVMQFSDISNLKKTEFALRENKTILDAIVDTMPAGVLIADEKGKIIRHNKAAIDLWGLPPKTESWEGYKDWKGWWPETGERIKAEEWGMARALLKGEEVKNELVQNQKFNSKEKKYFLNNAAPLNTVDGKRIGGVVAMQDVTDRIATEEALRKSEKKFRGVFEQAAIGIARVNFDDAKWIDVNAAFCEMLGYSSDEMMTTPWPEITHPDDVEIDLVPFKKMAAGELDNYSVEKRFIHKNGHHVWARLTLSLMRDEENRPDYEIAIIENISERKQAQEALQRSEERWNLALENFAEGAIIATENEQVIYWNPAARKMHGFTRPDEGIGPLKKTPVTFQLWTPDGNRLLELDEWPMRRIKRGETINNYELRLRRPDQKWEKYVSYSGSMVETANGERLIFLSIHDLTEQWKSETALRESEERFRTMADNISQLAWMADEKGWIFWYNQRWFDYTGTTLKEMQGWGWKKVHHPDHVDRVVRNVKHSWETGERLEEIFPLRGKNGKYRWFLTRAVPIRNEKGNIIRWFGTNTDITEHRKSEELLRKQARMLDQVQDAIVGLDNKGRITYMNEAAFSMYEIKKEPEVIGSKPGEYYTVQWDNIKSEQEMYTKLDEKGTWTGENIHVTAKGKRLWVDSVVSAVKDEKGKITGIISAMRNISHRKEMEDVLSKQLNELQKDNELFENILYIIAHDLKGPIANMYMALNLIHSVKETSEKIKMLEMFRPMIQRVENTIKGVTGLLQVQKTDESAAVKVYFESILNDILLELKENLRPGALESNFKRRTIYYIEPFLMSIMKNLVNNAIKYSREDVKMHIEISTESANGFILLTVKDNGIGIDLKKHRDELFSPFKRITPKKAEGTGVGLYIIKNIIEKNGGYIEVESTPGKGTAFYCYLKEYRKK